MATGHPPAVVIPALPAWLRLSAANGSFRRTMVSVSLCHFSLVDLASFGESLRSGGGPAAVAYSYSCSLYRYLYSCSTFQGRILYRLLSIYY